MGNDTLNQSNSSTPPLASSTVTTSNSPQTSGAISKDQDSLARIPIKSIPVFSKSVISSFKEMYTNPNTLKDRLLQKQEAIDR